MKEKEDLLAIICGPSIPSLLIGPQMNDGKIFSFI
jgi:hypothetical protein